MSLLALLQQKKEALAAGRRGKTAKPAPGRSQWRILPSWRGEGQQFWHDFGQFFIKDSSDTLLAIYVDTEKTFGRPSEISQLIASCIKSCTDDATMNLLKEAKSSGSVLLNAQQTDGANPNDVVILEVRPSVFEQMVSLAQEYEEAGQSVFDVDAGHEFVIQREGTGLKTKYTVQVAIKNKTTPGAAILKKLHDLDAYVAQENAEGNFKALNAVKSIAGLLPAAPSGAAGIPTTGAAARLAAPATPSVPADDDYAVAPPLKPKPAAAPAAAARPAAAPAADETPPFEDVPDLTAAPAAESTGDNELDALLAGLGS